MWPFGRRTRRDCPQQDSRGDCLFLRRVPSGQPLGPLGEKLAVKLIKRRGMKILARNYRCPQGEIDIIALDRSTLAATGRETIVFVEVKTRQSDRYTDPQSAVDEQKRHRIRLSARYYLRTRPSDGFDSRFDIVAIVAPIGAQARIAYIEGAF